MSRIDGVLGSADTGVSFGQPGQKRAPHRLGTNRGGFSLACADMKSPSLEVREGRGLFLEDQGRAE